MTFWDFCAASPYLTTFGGLAALFLLALTVEGWHARQCAVKAHEASCRAAVAAQTKETDQ
jgi:hypothetical protein